MKAKFTHHPYILVVLFVFSLAFLSIPLLFETAKQFMDGIIMELVLPSFFIILIFLQFREIVLHLLIIVLRNRRCTAFLNVCKQQQTA